MSTAVSITALESARDKARAAAIHPRVTELRQVLRSPGATPEQRRAAQSELAQLRPDRLLRQKQNGSALVAAQAALSTARRHARGQADTEAAAKVRGFSTADLEQRRAQLTQERRAIKQELRAVVLVLGERDAEQRTAELVATLSDDQKRALLQRLQAEGAKSAEKVGVPGSSR